MRYPSWGLSLILPFCLSFSKSHISYALCLVKVWTPHNLKPWVCTTGSSKSPWLLHTQRCACQNSVSGPGSEEQKTYQKDLIIPWALTDLGGQGSKAWLCSLTFLSSLVFLSFIELSEGCLYQPCKFNLCVILDYIIR